jgi:hypothetical protein
MSSIEFHGDRVVDRRGRVIAIGQSRVASMGPADPTAIARHTRDVLLARVKAGDPWSRVQVILRAHAPAALELFYRVALESFARRPPNGGCRWCVCLALGAVTGEPPHDDRHAALLGAACANCRKRQSIATARAKAQQEAALVAAGQLPPARRCAECRAWTPARPLVASGAVVPLAGPTKRCGTCSGWTPAVTAADVVVARVERGQRAIDDVMAGPPIWQPRRRSIAASRVAGTYHLPLPPRRRQG